jgi:hypothetical protein
MTTAANADASHYWLVGEEYLILARVWQHGERGGFTAEQIYARIDQYEDMAELTSKMEWPEATSENLAKWLADGTLKMLDARLPSE